MAEGVTNPMAIYATLITGVVDGGLSHYVGAHNAITRAIDALRVREDASDEIRVLEQISVELHKMQQDLRDGYRAAGPRIRIAALTDQWLGFAPLAR